MLAAPPAYLARHGAPGTPDQLAEHRLIRFEGVSPRRQWRFVHDGAEVCTKVDPGGYTNWAAECTEFRKGVVDKALAHKLVDRVEAAYRRTDFFERPRGLMEAWVKYLTCS